MRSDELQHRIFWRIRSQSIGCTGRIKTRHNRIRKPEKCRMGTRMEQSFFGSSHWSDSRWRGWEVSFERIAFSENWTCIWRKHNMCSRIWSVHHSTISTKVKRKESGEPDKKEDSPLDGVFWGRVFVAVSPLEKTADEYSSLFLFFLSYWLPWASARKIKRKRPGPPPKWNRLNWVYKILNVKGLRMWDCRQAVFFYRKRASFFYRKRNFIFTGKEL